MLIGQLDRADERFAFAHAMAIRAAGHEQIKLVRDLQVMLGDRGGMFRVKTFDSVQTRLDQLGNDLIASVQPRMRHDREATGLVNQFDGVGERTF